MKLFLLFLISLHAVNGISPLGKHFVISIPSILGKNPAAGEKCTLWFSAAERTTIGVVPSRTETMIPIVVDQVMGATLDVELPDSVTDGIEDLAVTVVSEVPISVQVYKFRSVTGEVYTALPIDNADQDYRYMLISMRGAGVQTDQYDSFYALAALKNDTQIGIYSPLLDDYPIAQFTLKESQTYSNRTLNSEKIDFTTYTVRSNRPISVLTGSLFTNVGGANLYDTAMFQAVDLSFNGKLHVVPPITRLFPAGTSKYRIRVVGVEDDTLMAIYDKDFEFLAAKYLEKWEVYEFIIDTGTEPSIVECDKNCTVTANVVKQAANRREGLYSFRVPPVEQGTRNSYFKVSPKKGGDDVVDITIISNTKELLFNGSFMSAYEWKEIQGTGLLYVSFTVNTANVEKTQTIQAVESGDSFQAYIHGSFSTHTMYGDIVGFGDVPMLSEENLETVREKAAEKKAHLHI